MGNYANGYKNARVVIRKISDGSFVDEFELPLTNEKGQIEDYEELFTKHETIEGEYEDFGFLGARTIWTLHYDQLIKKDTLFKLEGVWYYHSQPAIYKLLLYPRVDEPRRTFEVRLLTGKYSLGNKKKGRYMIGHRLPIIGFVTKKPGSKQFTDPDTIPVILSPNKSFVIVIKQ